MKKKDRYEKILAYFKKEMPEVTTELQFGSTFQLLVAVILSAQCTDKRVNKIAPELFAAYPTAEKMSEAEPYEVFEYVKSVSYPNSKAKHLVDMAKMIVDNFGGEVPRDFDSLVTLPGVGRKTANVIEAVAYGEAAMPVDTHVYRVSHRIGLVAKTCNTPLKVEMELKKNIPHDALADAHHWLLLHGRYICTSRAPHCDKCPIEQYCAKNLGEDSKLG
jgi:endonuclease-3